jgi:hypothetical protein
VLRAAAIGLLVACSVALLTPRPYRKILVLPAGNVELTSEIQVQDGTEVRGAQGGTVMHLGPGLRTAFRVGSDVYLHDFTVDGNRDAVEERPGLPAYDVSFAAFTSGNGIAGSGVHNLRVERVDFRRMAGFAILVSRGRDISIDRVRVEDSGSRNAAGRNNTTGGILLEEGTTGFHVTRCEFRNVRGNAVWTHSLYTSPRNRDGLIAWNRFEYIGRDAIQLGHATDVRVEENEGSRIGFPPQDVDIENRAIPVAIDTAGNVDGCVYAGNRFSTVRGKCIDLDGFHDGDIRGNVCRDVGNYGIVMNNTNPDMQPRNIRLVDNVVDGALFGGVFVIGEGNRVERNRLVHLNSAHCNEEAARSGCYYAAGEPDMLQSGIYLGRGAERPAPASGNVVADNEITGFHMKERCIAFAPDIPAASNQIQNNNCYNTAK